MVESTLTDRWPYEHSESWRGAKFFRGAAIALLILVSLYVALQIGGGRYPDLQVSPLFSSADQVTTLPASLQQTIPIEIQGTWSITLTVLADGNTPYVYQNTGTGPSPIMPVLEFSSHTFFSQSLEYQIAFYAPDRHQTEGWVPVEPRYFMDRGAYQQALSATYCAGYDAEGHFVGVYNSITYPELSNTCGLQQ